MRRRRKRVGRVVMVLGWNGSVVGGFCLIGKKGFKLGRWELWGRRVKKLVGDG